MCAYVWLCLFSNKNTRITCSIFKCHWCPLVLVVLVCFCNYDTRCLGGTLKDFYWGTLIFQLFMEEIVRWCIFYHLHTLSSQSSHCSLCMASIVESNHFQSRFQQCGKGQHCLHFNVVKLVLHCWHQALAQGWANCAPLATSGLSTLQVVLLELTAPWEEDCVYDRQ